MLFTAGQRAVLVGIACNHNPAQAIAAQCPLSGGDAVYAARSLYASIENVVYDDPEICWAQAISLRPNAPNTPKATIAKTDLVSQ